MSQSCLTVNVQAQYAADFGKLLSFLKSLDPVAVVVCIDNMNAITRVREIQQALPAAKVIGRYVFGQDGGMHMQPQAVGDTRKYIVSPLDALNAWGDLGKEGRVLYLLNEPKANGESQENIKRLVDWMLEAITIASERGIALVLGNFGVGHPMLLGNGEYDARFDDVVTALSKNRDTMALGMHVYQPADTFTRLDGLVKRCKMIGIKPPRVHITEAGFDAADGGDALNGYRSRGFSGRQFAGFLIDKLKNVYSPYIADDVLQSIAVFCWGNEASWKAFNVENDTDWQNTVLDAKNKGALTVPSKPVTKPFQTPIPKPENATDAIRIRVTNPTGINVRSGNGTEYQLSRTLEKGSEVTLYRSPFKTDSSGQTWRWVDVSAAEGGWLCFDALQYIDITPKPEPAPTQPPAVITLPPITLPTGFTMTADERKQIYEAIATMQSAMLTIVNVIGGLQEKTVDKAA